MSVRTDLADLALELSGFDLWGLCARQKGKLLVVTLGDESLSSRAPTVGRSRS